MLKSQRIEDFDGPFNRLIAERMRELGLSSLEDFAAYAEIGYTTLYNLVLGRVSTSGAIVRPSVETLARLSQGLQKPLGELIYIAAPEGYGKPPTFYSGLPEEVAIWPTNSPSGPGVIWGAFHTAPEYTVVEHPKAKGRTLVGYRIRGNAMAAGSSPILHGDIVIVDAAQRILDKETGIFRLQGGVFICRMLKETSPAPVLIAKNPEENDSAPSVVPLQEVDAIIGPVVRTIRDV